MEDDLKIVCNTVKWLQLAHDRVWWWALVNLNGPFGSLEPENSSCDKIIFFIQKSSIELIKIVLSVMTIHAISFGVSDRLTVNTRKGFML